MLGILTEGACDNDCMVHVTVTTGCNLPPDIKDTLLEIIPDINVDKLTAAEYG